MSFAALGLVGGPPTLAEVHRVIQVALSTTNDDITDLKSFGKLLHVSAFF